MLQARAASMRALFDHLPDWAAGQRAAGCAWGPARRHFSVSFGIDQPARRVAVTLCPHAGSASMGAASMGGGTSIDSGDSRVRNAIRLGSYVQQVKRSVTELRVAVKHAAAYREKCSLTLSAAMGATLALDQASPCVRVLAWGCLPVLSVLPPPVQQCIRSAEICAALWPCNCSSDHQGPLHTLAALCRQCTQGWHSRKGQSSYACATRSPALSTLPRLASRCASWP